MNWVDEYYKLEIIFEYVIPLLFCLILAVIWAIGTIRGRNR